MKTFLIFTTLLSLAFAENDLMQCVEGSPTGDKVAAALEACFGTENSDASRNDGECYDFNATISWITEVYANDMCVLGEMGWISNDGLSFDSDVVIADIQNLPQEISQALMEGDDEFELCVNDMVQMFGSDPCYNGTDSLYSDEDKAILAQIGQMVAEYECFKAGLTEACSGNDVDVLEQCVADSETGQELEAAFEFCFDNTNTRTEVNRIMTKPMSIQSRNENETQCYDYNTTMSWIADAYGDDYCVLNYLGWFLTNGTIGWNETEVIDDIYGLPTETANGLMEKDDEWQECIDYLTDMVSQDPCWSGSTSLYTDGEREELEQVGTMIAEYECFRHLLHETCFELYGNDDYYNSDDYAKK
jgi:hypothetical protein